MIDLSKGEVEIRGWPRHAHVGFIYAAVAGGYFAVRWADGKKTIIKELEVHEQRWRRDGFLLVGRKR